jgi:hypothetical protein
MRRTASRIADIGLRRQRLAAGLLDLAASSSAGSRIAGIIDDDGEAVLAETLGDRGTDASGSAGDERDLVFWEWSLSFSFSRLRRSAFSMSRRCAFSSCG